MLFLIYTLSWSSIAVHAGFYDTYTQTSTELNAAHASLQITCTKTLREIQKKYPDQNISVVFTGHSLGAAFSVLAAVDMAEVVEDSKFDNIKVNLVTFACPSAIGNKKFVDRMMELNISHIHYHHNDDAVTNIHSAGYVDVQQERRVIKKNYWKFQKVLSFLLFKVTVISDSYIFCINCSDYFYSNIICKCSVQWFHFRNFTLSVD